MTAILFLVNCMALFKGMLSQRFFCIFGHDCVNIITKQLVNSLIYELHLERQEKDIKGTEGRAGSITSLPQLQKSHVHL